MKDDWYYTSFKCLYEKCLFRILFLTHLLPRGDEPLDFAQLLAAFDEARFLTAGLWLGRAQTVWQRARLDTWFGACAQHRPLPQAAAALTGALPNEGNTTQSWHFTPRCAATNQCYKWMLAKYVSVCKSGNITDIELVLMHNKRLFAGQIQ